MVRAIVLVSLALAFAAAPVAADDQAGRHSGRVLEVADGGQSFVLEEMGPWLGPNTGLSSRVVMLTPSTSMRVVTPTGKWDADASPGYGIRPMSARDLKPGDAVNVTIGPDGRAATALEVMRVDNYAGLASPAGR